ASRSGSNMSAHVNGTTVGTGTDATNFASVSGYTLGYDMIGINSIVPGSSLPEVIAYPFALSPIQNQMVNTYLAVKYGISLSSNYVATDSTVVWDSSKNSAFSSHIVAMGRDDIEGLKQRQASSADSGRQLLMSRVFAQYSNINNNNGFATDKTYVICGDNGLNDSINSMLLSGYKMGRIWKAQTTNLTGNVRLAYPASAFNNSL